MLLQFDSHLTPAVLICFCLLVCLTGSVTISSSLPPPPSSLHPPPPSSPSPPPSSSHSLSFRAVNHIIYSIEFPPPLGPNCLQEPSVCPGVCPRVLPGSHLSASDSP